MQPQLTIPPNTNPDGLVFVLCDAHGIEVDRFATSNNEDPDNAANITACAERHSEYQFLNPGSYSAVYDGTSGNLLAAVGYGKAPIDPTTNDGTFIAA